MLFLSVKHKKRSSSGHTFSCTKRKWVKFVKHTNPYLTTVLAGDPWLGVWKTEQRKKPPQPATDKCTMKQIFLFKRQRSEQQLFDPCCLRDNGEKGIFVIALQRFPVQPCGCSSSRNWNCNNNTAVGQGYVASIFGVVLHIHIQFDCFQT